MLPSVTQEHWIIGLTRNAIVPSSFFFVILDLKKKNLAGLGLVMFFYAEELRDFR